MRFLITGLSHHTAPLDMRERLVFDQASLPRALRRLSDLLQGHQDTLVVSTCNRTEILLLHAEPESCHQPVRQFLLEKSGLDADRLEGALYVLQDLDAIRHLFRVAASLDSMVVGEPQILHQLKEAYRCVREEKVMSSLLDALCQRAFAVAKRVRRETGIGRNPVSISYAAAELARAIFGKLDERTVLVLGAGKMSALTLRHIKAAGASQAFITSRRLDRALDLAHRIGAQAVAFNRMHEFLERADIVISSTAAPHHLLSHADVAALMRRRRQRPIFFIDIAVPRDIDPEVNDLDNVYLYDIDDLQRVVDENRAGRDKEAGLAESIIESEVQSFQTWFRGLAAAPTITALRTSVDSLREKELERIRPRLAGLTTEQLQVVEQFSRGLVNKILHRPTSELRRSVDGRGAPGQVELVQRLFGLDSVAGDGHLGGGEQDQESSQRPSQLQAGSRRRRGTTP